MKVLFSIILLFPVLGMLGVFPAPTRDLYNTDAAFAFIMMLGEAGYINYMMAVVHLAAFAALWTRREALAVLLMTPIVANIIGFHTFLDGGLLSSGAILANVLLLITIYFLWKNRSVYATLFEKR